MHGLLTDQKDSSQGFTNTSINSINNNKKITNNKEHISSVSISSVSGKTLQTSKPQSFRPDFEELQNQINKKFRPPSRELVRLPSEEKYKPPSPSIDSSNINQIRNLDNTETFDFEKENINVRGISSAGFNQHT